MLGAIVAATAVTIRGLRIIAQIELAAAGAVLLALAGLLLARQVRRWRTARPAADDERRARALMGELCPNGWRAQITVYDTPASAPPDAPHFDGGLVAIDWAELPEDDDEPPPPRRVWAPSIAAALAAMVDDRRTDEVLERIERSANGDEEPWEDA